MHMPHIVGYPGDGTTEKELLVGKIRIFREIISKFTDIIPDRRILVAGSGDGAEVELIRDILDVDVVGVDISVRERVVRNRIEVRKEDLHSLSFADSSFDFIYSYHVLEHVADPRKVIRELHRVLRIGGLLYIGFPNRHRLFGYIGSHKKSEKHYVLKANLRDYKMRALGQFRNALGAHAGFSHDEFASLSSNIFNSIYPVHYEYMSLKYPKYKKAIDLITKLQIEHIIFPSLYYVCKKNN